MKAWIQTTTVIGAGLSFLVTTASLHAAPPKANHTPKVARKVDKKPGPAVGVPPTDISPEAAEVVWLFHKGFKNDELLGYVNRSHADFKLSATDVNYLTDVGISSPVVFAMLRSPRAREDVVRLRERTTQWLVPPKHAPMSKVGGHHEKDIEPTSIQPVNDGAESDDVPNYYRPYYDGPAPRYPSPYNVPPHFGRGIDNRVLPGDPRFNPNVGPAPRQDR
jgi:hypothetical protein